MPLTFQFLDTGMGDGTLIEFPDSEDGPFFWLADFGEKWSPTKIPAIDATKFLIERIGSTCKRKGFTSPYIDMLSISHPDGDHFNKLGWLITGVADPSTPTLNYWEKYFGEGATLEIKNLIFGGFWSEYQDKERATADAVIAAVTKFDPATVKDRITDLASNDHDKFVSPGVVKPRWTFFNGTPNKTNVYLLNSNYPNKSGPANPKSLILMFEYANTKVILPGDAEENVESQLITRYGVFLKSYGLKLGHHGSAKSCSTAFINLVRPEIIFASGDAKWGHPYCEAVTRAKAFIGRSTQRRYVCSASGLEDKTLDYRNTTTDEQVCTNLWYLVLLPAVTLDDLTEPKGTYTGVQWDLQITSAGSKSSAHTDQWPSV